MATAPTPAAAEPVYDLRLGRYRLAYSDPDNRHNGILHVRAIVDEEYAVVRRWRKGRWHYELLDVYWFKVHADSSFLTYLGE